MPVKNRAERTLIAVKILHQMADYAEYTARELAQIIGENVHIISGAMRYLKARATDGKSRKSLPCRSKNP